MISKKSILVMYMNRSQRDFAYSYLNPFTTLEINVIAHFIVQEMEAGEVK